jgi:hypothetical protein
MTSEINEQDKKKKPPLPKLKEQDKNASKI